MARVFVLVFCVLSALLAEAATEVDGALAIKTAIADFLRIQLKGLPGSASFTIGNLNPDSAAAPCATPQVSFPKGSRPWGQTTVLVECNDASHWAKYVSVRIKVRGTFVVAGKSLQKGQILADSDLALQTGDLTDLPAGVLTERALGVGRILEMPVAAGMPIRSELLRQAAVVQQGQTVKVTTVGQGFQVSSEGQALNSASEGQVVKVRLPNGQVVSGLARSGGQVDISY